MKAHFSIISLIDPSRLLVRNSQMKQYLCLLITAGCASAATVTQTASFGISQALTTGETTFAGPALFVTTIGPFDQSLGSLDSVSVIWEVAGQVSGTLPNGGSASISYGGPVFMGTVQIAAFGGGNGTGGGPGTVFDFPFSLTQTALYSETQLNPGDADAWALVNGAESFTAIWSSPFTLNISGDVTGAAAGDVSMSVIYNYTAIPEPSGSALVLVSAFALLARRRRNG